MRNDITDQLADVINRNWRKSGDTPEEYIKNRATKFFDVYIDEETVDGFYISAHFLYQCCIYTVYMWLDVNNKWLVKV